MVRYLRSDATSLSDEDIRDIINAKDLMNRASEVMAKKYKISPRRVYQIWRGEHPPTAPVFDITGTEHSNSFKAPQRGKEAEMIEIKDDDLKAFYERETQRGKKNIEHSLPLLSDPAEIIN
jgi:hypothetical protein